MRKLLFNLHLYVALVAGVFVTILGVTGAIMAFEPEIDHVTHPHRTYVTPQGERKTLAELAAAANKVASGRPLGYALATAPNGAWGIQYRDAFVFVNPYTGEVLDVDRSTSPSFLGWVHSIHLRLATPFWMKNRDPHKIGAKIMDWSGVAALFLTISGLYLWWPTKRVRVQWRKGERKSWFDLHNAVGVISLLFLLILCLTGLMIGFEETTTPLAYKITGSKPVEQPDFRIDPKPGAALITADKALEIARTTFPGANPILLMEPNPRQLLRVGLRYPEDRTPGGRTRLLLDPYSGMVAFADSSRTTAAGSKIVIWNRAIHTGDIFGIPSKTIMSLASLAIALQMISGMVMWWKRTGAVRRQKRAQAAKAQG